MVQRGHGFGSACSESSQARSRHVPHTTECAQVLKGLRVFRILVQLAFLQEIDGVHFGGNNTVVAETRTLDCMKAIFDCVVGATRETFGDLSQKKLTHQRDEY